MRWDADETQRFLRDGEGDDSELIPYVQGIIERKRISLGLDELYFVLCTMSEA